MSSENRAAHALGRNYPGGLPAFVQAMNAKARKLGMTSAHFVDPAGLSCDNVASAEDLSKLVMAASENPVIREYSTDRVIRSGLAGEPSSTVIRMHSYRTRPGTSSSRRRATSPKRVDAW